MSYYVRPGEDSPIVIEGLPFYEKERLYRRLMIDPPEKLADDVERLTWDTAGVKFRFRTDASEIFVRAELSRAPWFTHMTTVGEAGFDCYIGRGGEEPVFNCSCSAESNNPTFVDACLYSGDAVLQDVEINCPLYDGLKSVEIGFSDGAKIYPPKERAGRRILLYGSSIDQGCSASRPGMCHGNILSRWLDSEIINLGFSGAGRYDVSSALAVREVPGVSMFLLNGYGNLWSPEHVETAVPEFIGCLREKYPETPVLLFGMPPRVADNTGIFPDEPHESMARAVEKVAAEMAKTDPHIYTARLLYDFDVDGHSFDHEALIDGGHPTDLGFVLEAQQLYREILRIQAAEAGKETT